MWPWVLLETQVESAGDLGYLDQMEGRRSVERLDHETRMLRNLIKKL